MAVYFAQAANDPDGPIKIGFSSDVQVRARNLSAGSVGGVVILATVPGGMEVESYLHEKFADLRIRGEWFANGAELREFVERAASGKALKLPIDGRASYFVRDTAKYGADAVERAKLMTNDILEAEFRGVGDTIDSAMSRVEMRTGFPAKHLHRLRYRELSDIPAGLFLQICEIWEPLADALAGKETAVNAPE
jgi:T5orf172 domain